MSRAARIALVFLGLQAALLLVYLAVEQARRPRAAESVRRGEPAPELAYRTHGGRTRSLAAHRGRPVVLHFWATWCPPCRDELPALLDFARDPRFDVLAVALDREWGPVERFVSPLPPAVVLGRSEDVVRAYGVATLPATFLVDAQGIVKRRLDGAQDWRAPAMRAWVSSLIGEGRGGS